MAQRKKPRPKTRKAQRPKAADRRRRTERAADSTSITDLQMQVAALSRELAEARGQQTATSEVLKVISSSPGELEPVFQAMLENATRICEAKLGMMFLFKDGMFHPAALLGAPPAYADLVWKRGPFFPEAGSPL